MNARSILYFAIGFVAVGGFSSPASAQLQLIWEVDRSFAIENVGAVPLRFDSYSIRSEDGHLQPELWVSLEDSFAADSAKALATLGLHEMSPVSSTRFNIAESSMGNGATLQPGAIWEIGRPFGLAATFEEVCFGTTFEYNDVDGVVGGGTQAGDVICFPEPSSLLLVLAGLPLGLLLRRQTRRA